MARKTVVIVALSLTNFDQGVAGAGGAPNVKPSNIEFLGAGAPDALAPVVVAAAGIPPEVVIVGDGGEGSETGAGTV